MEVRGEILELKNTVNTMVDQLSSFAAEVTRVAREVGTEGKLGGQADVRDVGLAQDEPRQVQPHAPGAEGSARRRPAHPVGARARRGGHHGAFYLVDAADERLKLLAGYALEPGAESASEFPVGVGLVGQCAREKQKILLANVPKNYLRITSGLGEAAPQNVIILPVVFEGQVKGVIELASFERFSATHQAFLDQLTETIGIVINTIEANMRTEGFLKQSQSLAAELQQTNQELQEKARLLAHQNEEVERKNREVEQARQALEEKAAIKYTDPGGAIWVTLKGESDDVVLAVRDEGIGISQDMLAHVFELFVQAGQSLDRAQGGLGVGLTLVRQLVELQGGTVTATSDGPGLGSVFTVRLPRVAAPAGDGVAVAAPEAPAPAGLRVLVVEDNTDAREMLRSLLELSGHEVYEAADGPAGVECALKFRPDVALVDLGLPGFDGIEVAGRLRSAVGEDLVLVALTGYGQAMDRQRTLSAGFDAHLVKPVATEHLADVLRVAAEHAANHGRGANASR